MTPLHADLRFRAAPLDLRGIYRLLLDYQDAAGDIAAPGVDGVAAVAAALGCSNADSRELVARLSAAALVRVEPFRVCLLVGSVRGRDGGMSAAERKRRSRVGHGHNVTDGHGQVTGETPVIAGQPENGHGLVTAPVSHDVTGKSSPSPALSPSPLTLPSPSLPTLSPSSPAGGVASTPSVQPTDAPPAKQGGLFADEPADPKVAPKKPRTRKPTDPDPLPFKVGEALDALAAASAGRVVRGEGRDISRAIAIGLVAQIRAYPTLAEWELVGAWLADGALAHRGTLGPSWVASAAFREAMALARDWAAKNRPAPNAPATRAAPASNPHRGIQPPAPIDAYEHVKLSKALGVKWPGYDPNTETREAAFKRICGLSLDEARARVPTQPTTVSRSP